MDVSPIKERGQPSSFSPKIKREEDLQQNLGSMPTFLQMENILHPTDQDVLCGRGVTTNRHPGNESFRALVNCNKELYVSSTKKNKMNISRSIVEAVRSKEPMPGRFLEKNSNGTWFDIGDKKAIEKTSQALRDGAAHLRKQLSEDLSDPDFLSAVFSEDNNTSTAANSNTTTNSRNNNSTKSATPPPITTTAQDRSTPNKRHRRIKSDPSAILIQSSPVADTPYSSTKTQGKKNISPFSPAPKLRKCGENDMMIKQSNSFNSPMNPARRITPEEPRAPPLGRVLPPHIRTNNPLPTNINNTRHKRHHTMTGPYNYPDGMNPDTNVSIDNTVMQETKHAFQAPERPGGYHPPPSYMAHSSPVKRNHSPYRPPPTPHSPYPPPLSPNGPRSNSPHYHSHSPTFVRTLSPYHSSTHPGINRTNSQDSNRSSSPYHPPGVNNSSNDMNHSAYQFHVINRSDSYDSYHQKTSNNSYRPQYHNTQHSTPPRPNSNPMIKNDMLMPDFSENSRYPDKVYHTKMNVTFRNGILSPHPTSPRNYNIPPLSHVNKQPLPTPPHLSQNEAMYSEPLRLRYENSAFFHQNNLQNENSMIMEGDDNMMSDDDLKMITPLPFNVDDHSNCYQRERTISENTLIGLQHL